MTTATKPIEVTLEIGKTRTFAIALEWPGWSRAGRDEESALQALYDHGPRYARVLQNTVLGFQTPSELSQLVVVERQTGNATTDFGAPSLALDRDTHPVDSNELEQWQIILQACWQAFDDAVQGAQGRTLSTGPRGGGRDLNKMTEHVRDVDITYLKSLGGTLTLGDDDDPLNDFPRIRQAILDALVDAVNGDIPAQGPRGGKRWTPRYFVRRLAWHELDHVWEIENRIQ